MTVVIRGRSSQDLQDLAGRGETWLSEFLSRYLRARKEDGLSAEEAVRVTFRSVGKALWTTTLVLSAGFLAFAGSGFQVSWVLGLLVTVIIADFLLLPPLLMALDRRKQ